MPANQAVNIAQPVDQAKLANTAGLPLCDGDGRHVARQQHVMAAPAAQVG